MCEEKHMGSRAVVIVGKDERSIAKRFGITKEGAGICYTRTGRRFFDNPKLESELIEEVKLSITKADMWDEFGTDWFVLDCELMPWSAKAQELIKDQYAAVGAAARTSLQAALGALNQAEARGIDVSALKERFTQREKSVNLYTDSYQRYCWNVTDLSDYKLAPFHIMASEGKVHINENHQWHMEKIAKIAEQSDGLIISTAHKIIDLTDTESVATAVAWWTELTEKGRRRNGDKTVRLPGERH